MKYISALLATAMACAGISANAQSESDRPEMGNVCRTYSGDGIYVTTARIGPEQNREVLIGVTGVDHRWNGKLFKAKVKTNNADFDYVIQVDGQDYHIFVHRKNSGYSVYLKNYGGGKIEQRVSYSERSSSECKPEYLLTEYLEQQENEQGHSET